MTESERAVLSRTYGSQMHLKWDETADQYDAVHIFCI